MKREILQKILDDLFPTCQQIVEVKKRQHNRILFACRVEGDKIVGKRILLLSGDKDTDDVILKAAARIVPEDGVCVMVDEVWGKFAFDGSALPEINDGTRVKDVPGAKEGVIFSFFGRGWEACAFCEIKRKPLKLLKGEIYDHVRSEGRLSPSA